ncbi:hypothetical protein FRC07_003439 [Ceratobasidium sp. 392]|nr:hypothetical protein FRC07_003439 [Ceratobasidium sp. 392]
MSHKTWRMSKARGDRAAMRAAQSSEPDLCAIGSIITKPARPAMKPEKLGRTGTFFQPGTGSSDVHTENYACRDRSGVRGYTYSNKELATSVLLIWNSSPEELGLTADQLRDEQKWIKAFNEAGDELSWDKWQDYWEDDAFLVIGNKFRLEGKPALAQHFNAGFKFFKSAKHEVVRHSYDLPRGLLYQTMKLYKVLHGDPENKNIVTPSLSVIHRKIGEPKIRGVEAYEDLSEYEAAIKAVLSKSA